MQTSININPDLYAKLQSFANEAQQTPDEYASSLLQDCLNYDEWLNEKIKTGLHDIETGNIVTHEEVLMGLRARGLNVN